MVKLKLARAYSHPQSTSHSMGREKTEAVRRKIIKMSEKEKKGQCPVIWWLYKHTEKWCK